MEGKLPRNTTTALNTGLVVAIKKMRIDTKSTLKQIGGSLRYPPGLYSCIHFSSFVDAKFHVGLPAVCLMWLLLDSRKHRPAGKPGKHSRHRG